jgi:hypothetical protein
MLVWEQLMDYGFLTPASDLPESPQVPLATIELSDFAWASLEEEADRQGVSVEDLLAHAAMYYLGDLDSGRVARSALVEESPEDGPGRPKHFKRSTPK